VERPATLNSTNDDPKVIHSSSPKNRLFNGKMRRRLIPQRTTVEQGGGRGGHGVSVTSVGQKSGENKKQSPVDEMNREKGKQIKRLQSEKKKQETNRLTSHLLVHR
jgi:hypothetical protein